MIKPAFELPTDLLFSPSVLPFVHSRESSTPSRSLQLTKAEYIITLTWPPGQADDLDLWVKTPSSRVDQRCGVAPFGP